MTLTQTVTIPANHRLIIDIPHDFPEGLATLTFASAVTKPSIPQNNASDNNDAPFLRWFGCHKGVPGASVDDFLARCREDKERELALEERQIEEHGYNVKLSP